MPFFGFDGVQCLAQTLPTASEILKDTKSLQIPSVGYKVDVIQTVTTLPATTDTQDPIPVHSGIAEFEPGIGLQRVQSEAAKLSDEVPTITLMVDIGTFLDELNSYADVTVELVELEGRPNYLLTGQDSQGLKEVLIWIDQQHTYVSRIKFSISDQAFAEIDVEYSALQNKYWLPKSIKVHHFTDDSRIVLDFSAYTFTK